MGLFDERIAYKPFEYPEYYTEGWLKQAQAFWLHTEIPMQGDVKDWKEKLNDKEKNLVGNILLGFAQTECAVSDYWTQKVVSWFPKHEIQQMAMMFGSQETIHAVAYSYLNETLGLEDYEAFFNGTKNLVIENNTPTFVARIEDETQVDKEVFTQSYNNFKQNLEFSISMKPSHSKITEAQACLSFINTIDVDSISYPTDHLDKQMKDNGTFVALSAF